MVFHNELISNQKSATNSKICPHVKRFGKWLKKEEKWKPLWEDRIRQESTDKALNNTIQKIKNAKSSGATDCQPPRHAMKYKKWRSENPGFLPGWTEALWIKAQLGKHASIVKNAAPRIKTRIDPKIDMFKHFRDMNPPLPPINEPTPAQYRAAKLGQKAKKRRGASRRGSLEDKGDTGSVSPAKTQTLSGKAGSEWPAAAELNYLSQTPDPSMTMPQPFDENLVKYVYNMSMSTATNDNVQRLLEERTAHKFPTLMGELGQRCASSTI